MHQPSNMRHHPTWSPSSSTYSSSTTPRGPRVLPDSCTPAATYTAAPSSAAAAVPAPCTASCSAASARPLTADTAKPRLEWSLQPGPMMTMAGEGSALHSVAFTAASHSLDQLLKAELLLLLLLLPPAEGATAAAAAAVSVAAAAGEDAWWWRLRPLLAEWLRWCMHSRQPAVQSLWRSSAFSTSTSGGFVPLCLGFPALHAVALGGGAGRCCT